MIVVLLAILALIVGLFLASVDRKVEKILDTLLKVSATSDRNDLSLDDRLKALSSRLEAVEKKIKSH